MVFCACGMGVIIILKWRRECDRRSAALRRRG